MLKLKQQQTGGCWKREIYDSEGYEVIFRINPDTGKLVKINFKSKNPMNFIEIINLKISEKEAAVSFFLSLCS